jgi:putative Mn2+ efflux pump MntP
MNTHGIILLLALLIPLTLDTFVVSTALGLAGLKKQHHLRTSLILALFEAGMPAIGVLLGRVVAGFAGDYAEYTAATVIGLAGLILLKPGGNEQDSNQAKLLSQAHGLAIINLGLSISIDELALGLSLGLLHVPLLLAVVLIGLQAFVASQLGLRLGEKLNDQFREHAEKIAGILLVVIALVLIVLKISGHDFSQ